MQIQCTLLFVSIDEYNLIITKHLEWYYANTLNAFVKHNSWKWHVHCCLISLVSLNINSKQLEWYYARTPDVFCKKQIFLNRAFPTKPIYV